MAVDGTWPMAKLSATPGITPRYEHQWDARVVQPVQEALKKNFANNNQWADASHVTYFIVKALGQEILDIIEHVAYARIPKDFASIVIMASVAPKGIYTVICQCLQAFAALVTTTGRLPAQGRVRSDRYFAALTEQTDIRLHPGTRVSLMFIRDAIYISSPSNVEDVASLQSHLPKTAIERRLRLLTLSMCADALGTPAIVEEAALRQIAPLLARSMIHFGERSYTNLIDPLSDTPPTGHSSAARRNQIFTFLEGFCPKSKE